MPLISKNRIKYIQSLHKKKYRQRYGQFTVEGLKSVNELINSTYPIVEIFASEEVLSQLVISSDNQILTSVTEEELNKMSYFSTSSPIIAISGIPDESLSTKSTSPWSIALDGINDPGNLGTIVRIADWYGISDIYCSEDSVEFYNPKTIAATMGSFTRVNVHYVNLETWLKSSDERLYYCLMDGEPLHQVSQIKEGIIVIGSESHGIRNELVQIPHQAITIARIGRAESLNAGIAAGIICERLIQPKL